MIKRYCDRCRKEMSQYSLFTGKIVADMGERPVLTNSLEYELCAECVNLLLDFLTFKPNPIITSKKEKTDE